MTGGATATFYDDVTQNGALTVSEVGSTNSVAVFLGNVYGSGATGGGDIFYEGEIHPGSSPALVTYVNDVTFGSGATLEIELGGSMRGSEYDAIDITGDLSLGGMLNVVPISLGDDVFRPGQGDVFEILTATGGISGGFTAMNLPDLAGDLYWDVLQDTNSLTLQVLAAGLPGDYNQNGIVDAADYVVWRKTGGMPQVYDTWRSHFGQTAGSGAALPSAEPLSAAVPEPSTLGLLILVAMGSFSRQRRSEA